MNNCIARACIKLFKLVSGGGGVHSTVVAFVFRAAAALGLIIIISKIFKGLLGVAEIY